MLYSPGLATEISTIENSTSEQEVLDVLTRSENWKQDSGFEGNKITHKLSGGRWIESGLNGEKDKTEIKEKTGGKELEEHKKIIGDLAEKKFSIIIKGSHDIHAGTESAKTQYDQKIHAIIYTLEGEEIVMKIFQGTAKEFKEQFKNESWMEDFMDGDDLEQSTQIFPNKQQEEKTSNNIFKSQKKELHSEAKTKSTAWEKFWDSLFKPQAPEEQTKPPQQDMMEFFSFSNVGRGEAETHYATTAEVTVLNFFSPAKPQAEALKTPVPLTSEAIKEKPVVNAATQLKNPDSLNFPFLESDLLSPALEPAIQGRLTPKLSNKLVRSTNIANIVEDRVIYLSLTPEMRPAETKIEDLAPEQHEKRFATEVLDNEPAIEALVKEPGAEPRQIRDEVNKPKQTQKITSIPFFPEQRLDKILKPQENHQIETPGLPVEPLTVKTAPVSRNIRPRENIVKIIDSPALQEPVKPDTGREDGTANKIDVPEYETSGLEPAEIITSLPEKTIEILATQKQTEARAEDLEAVITNAVETEHAAIEENQEKTVVREVKYNELEQTLTKISAPSIKNKTKVIERAIKNIAVVKLEQQSAKQTVASIPKLQKSKPLLPVVKVAEKATEPQQQEQTQDIEQVLEALTKMTGKQEVLKPMAILKPIEKSLVLTTPVKTLPIPSRQEARAARIVQFEKADEATKLSEIVNTVIALKNTGIRQNELPANFGVSDEYIKTTPENFEKALKINREQVFPKSAAKKPTVGKRPSPLKEMSGNTATAVVQNFSSYDESPELLQEQIIRLAA